MADARSQDCGKINELGCAGVVSGFRVAAYFDEAFGYVMNVEKYGSAVRYPRFRPLL